jgi:integrating conjugative element protein (TIGR03757 family)
LFGSVAKHVETTFCMTHRESMLKDSGLVQAMQYGIDRYPAIVFDGKAVVYGITDVRAATQRYQQWQAGEARP